MQIEGYPEEGQPLNDSPILDTFEEFGLIYIESDNRTAPPEKKRETTSYAEEEGEHTDPRTVDDVFDYKITFLLETRSSNLENANINIKKFNDAIRSVSNGVKTCRRIALYNDYKRFKIVGIPELLSEPKEFWRDKNGKQYDCVLIELTIHVDKPSECDFSLNAAVWNQLAPPVNPDNYTQNSSGREYTRIEFDNGTINVTVTDVSQKSFYIGTTTRGYIPVVPGHHYLIGFEINSSVDQEVDVRLNSGASPKVSVPAGEWFKARIIDVVSEGRYYTGLSTSFNEYFTEEHNTYSIRKFMLIDLTLIYGAGSEPSSPEQFEEDYQRIFKKPLDYIEYTGQLSQIQTLELDYDTADNRVILPEGRERRSIRNIE